MDHDLILKYALGVGVVPTFCFLLLYGLWKLGTRLIDAHMKFLDAVQAQGKEVVTKVHEVQNSIVATAAAAATAATTAATAATAAAQAVAVIKDMLGDFECRAQPCQAVPMTPRPRKRDG